MKTDRPDEKQTRDLNLEKDRKFPESAHAKDQRRDAELRDDADLEALNEDVDDARTTTRNTGTSSEDRAGVSDLDRGMRRAEDV